MVDKVEELERAIEKSFKKLKKDKYMVFMALAFVHKATGPSAIRTGKYDEFTLRNDLEKYLLNKFNFQRSKSIKLWTILKRNLLGETDCKDFLEDILKKINFYKFEYYLYSEYSDIIEREIISQLKKMNSEQKAIIFTFLEYKDDPEIPITGANMQFLNQFITERYNLIFGKIPTIKTISNISKLLIQTGLLFESKWIKYDGSESEYLFRYPIYLNEITGSRTKSSDFELS